MIRAHQVYQSFKRATRTPLYKSVRLLISGLLWLGIALAVLLTLF